MPNQNFFANQYKKTSESLKSDAAAANSNQSKPDAKKITKPVFEKLPAAAADDMSLRQVKKFEFKKLEDVMAAEQKPAAKPTVQTNRYDSLGIPSKKRLAAMYLICTDSDKAAKIVATFDLPMLVKISEQILDITEITEEDLQHVEKNFGPQNITDLSELKGGKEFLRQLLLKAFGVAKGSELFLTVLEKTDVKSFAFLENVSAENVCKVLSEESALIISFVLSKLTPAVAADVLNRLSKDKATEIVRLMSAKTEINSDVLDIVAKKIKEKTNRVIKKDDTILIDGKDKLIDILKHSDAENMNSLLDRLASDEPELAQQLRDNIFTFNDIPSLSKHDLEKALKDVSNDSIAFMLKGTSDSMKNVFFAAVSKRRAEEIMQQITLLGQVKKTDVTVKQQEFVNLLKQLDAEGSISIYQDDEVYVN